MISNMIECHENVILITYIGLASEEIMYAIIVNPSPCTFGI